MQFAAAKSMNVVKSYARKTNRVWSKSYSKIGFSNISFTVQSFQPEKDCNYLESLLYNCMITDFLEHAIVLEIFGK